MHCNLTAARFGQAFTSLIILLAALSFEHASAQEAPMIDRFMGEWEGQGKLFGLDATFSMTWESVLGQQFVRLTFQNSIETDSGTARTLKAQAFYKPTGTAEFEGTWFDSRGVVQPLRGSVEAETLTVLWGTPETEQGRTIYRLVDKNQIEVEDFVLRDGEWAQFGSASYRRVGP